MSASGTADRPHSGASTTELREDAPLNKWSNAGSGACAGPRTIASFFCALSATITVALFTQIYYGDFEVPAHGSVASSAAACSTAGTDALRAGGGAFDAAAAAALCLAVVAPHRAGFDASGSLMLWDYRSGRSQPPLVAQWGGENRSSVSQDPHPRMLGALAFLHTRFGRLPWSRVLQPAVDLATNGTSIPTELASTSQLDPQQSPLQNQLPAMPKLADFLGKLQQQTSHQLAEAYFPSVNITEAQTVRLGGWILHLPSNQPTADAASKLLTSLFENSESLSAPSSEELTIKLAGNMKKLQTESKWPTTGVATGIAVIDTRDVYASLVVGLSKWEGTEQQSVDGWLRDDAGSTPPPPAILAQEQTCGQRYVVGAGDTAALVQVMAALMLTKSSLLTAVEQPRILPLSTGGLSLESRTTSSSALLGILNALGVTQNVSEPYPSVNVVQQTGDVLRSHADSRGGGHASRF